MLCKFSLHKYETKKDTNTTSDNHGNCVIRLRCIRCGKITYKKTQQKHDFDSPIISYECNGNTYHICNEIKKLVCKVCGYAVTKKNKVFEKEAGTRQGCTEKRQCPGCMEHFSFFLEDHQNIQTGRYFPTDFVCNPEFKCELCGKVSVLGSVSHQFDKGKSTGCIEIVHCNRCGQEVIKDHHDWVWVRNVDSRVEKVGNNQVSIKHFWNAEHKCQICEKVKLELRTSSDHQYGDWKIVSECIQTRKCKICESEEAKENHDWERIRIFNHFHEYRGIQRWDEEHRCRICGHTKIEHQFEWMDW